MLKIILFSISIALSVSCGNKTEIIQPSKTTVNKKYIKLPDVTGKKMSDVKINMPEFESEYDKLIWTFSRKFTDEDVEMAKLAVKFLEKLTGISYNCNYNNMYWSDDMLKSLGTNNSLLGMTVFYEYREPWRAYIAITSSLKPPSVHDLNAIRDFGTTVIHECLHAGNLDIESTVRSKIEKPIDMSYSLYCNITVSNFYAINISRFKNKPYTKMIEKVAFESGIKAPWHYNSDYTDEPIKTVIKILMVPERPINIRTNWLDNITGLTNFPPINNTNR
jgi:hypothetical protein